MPLRKAMGFFSSLGIKLTLATVSVLLAVSALLFVELSGRERQSLVAAKVKAAEMVADLFAASLGAPADFGDSAGLDVAVGYLAGNAEVEYAAVWMGNESVPVAELRGGGSIAPHSPLRVPSTQVGPERIEIGRAIVGGSDKVIGSALVRFSLSAENATYRASRLRLLGYSAGGVAITAWLLIGIARRQIIRPLRRLMEASRQLQQGDGRAKVEVTSNDEVGQLGLAFNNMAAALQDRRRLELAVQAQKEEHARETATTLDRTSRELVQAKLEVAVKERLEKEMEIATQIQTALLPRDLAVKGMEIAARMNPASEVGGDYYDILPIENGCWLTIGDVSGHGVTAGLIMLMVQSVISALTKVDPLASPRKVLGQLNRPIFDNIRNRLEKDEFMTLCLIRYDASGQLVMAGAHEEIIVCHPQGPCERLTLEGTWLGLVPDLEQATKERAFRLRPGDLLVLHTDGLTEARSASGELFGLDRLSSEIERARERPVEEIRDRLLATINAWAPTQEDDMTLLVARFTGSAAPQPS